VCRGLDVTEYQLAAPALVIYIAGGSATVSPNAAGAGVIAKHVTNRLPIERVFGSFVTMTPDQRRAIAHEISRARRSYAAAPPFTTVTVQRETMMSLLAAAEESLAREDGDE
jgi:hypothetical protein